MTDQDMNMEGEAKALGWVPKEDFRGNPDKWVDADSFVERGKSIMPILRKNNEKLLSDVNQLRGELGTLKSALVASTEAIEALKGFHGEETKRQVVAARKELIVQLTQAREANDVEAEVKITGELHDLKVAETAADTRGGDDEDDDDDASRRPSVDYTSKDWYQSWASDNAWFGTDKRRTSLAVGIAEELRQSNPELKERAFLDRVVAEVDKMLGGRRQVADKVEGSRGGGNGGSTGKGYGDLPADAKAACDRQANRLVGEGRAFKDMASWRKYYTATYFGDTQS
jgi:hypothetical protein